MDFQVNWTEPALHGLEGLVRFIAHDDPEAALRVGHQIVTHVGILSSFPEIGPVYRKRSGGNVRQVTCLGYRIFYRVKASRQTVEVLHVWHGARRDPEDLG